MFQETRRPLNDARAFQPCAKTLTSRLGIFLDDFVHRHGNSNQFVNLPPILILSRVNFDVPLGLATLTSKDLQGNRSHNLRRSTARPAFSREYELNKQFVF
jgi:hypothetical protein